MPKKKKRAEAAAPAEPAAPAAASPPAPAPSQPHAPAARVTEERARAQLAQLRKVIMPRADACARCQEPAAEQQLSSCARCGIAKYCSRACQVAHWPGHKESCRLYSSALQIVRENEDRAAWLQAMDKTPYIWPVDAPMQLQSAASQTLRRHAPPTSHPTQCRDPRVRRCRGATDRLPVRQAARQVARPPKG